MTTLVEVVLNDYYETLDDIYYRWGWEDGERGLPSVTVALKACQPSYDAGYEDAKESMR